MKEGYAIDIETGEAREIVINKEVSSQNFWKIFLTDILTVLGIISNSKQLDVVLYIMGNTKQSDNMFIGTYSAVAEKTGISEKTVAVTFRKLLQNDFLRKIQNGVYQVNPKYMVKGNENKRRMIINYYNTLKPYEESEN